MSSAISSDPKRRHIRLVVALSLTGATIVFFGVLLWYYNFRPTVGTIVLMVGWCALMLAGTLLTSAALTLDMSRGGPSFGELSDDRKLELVREKRLLLKAIKEIEFDQGMGKIDAGEAAGAIARYRARALEIMKLLVADEEQGSEKSARYEALVERELARRIGNVPSTCSCGTKNDVDATFCKKCGRKLEGGA